MFQLESFECIPLLFCLSLLCVSGVGHEHATVHTYVEVRRQLAGVTLLLPRVSGGSNSGSQVWHRLLCLLGHLTQHTSCIPLLKRKERVSAALTMFCLEY